MMIHPQWNRRKPIVSAEYQDSMVNHYIICRLFHCIQSLLPVTYENALYRS